MDAGVIVYTAELEAPALRETARRILEAEAARFGASLETGDVQQRRTRGGNTMHLIAAADELVRHLAAAETDPLSENSALMVLARAAALALVSRVEGGRRLLAFPAPPMGAGLREGASVRRPDAVVHDPEYLSDSS